MLERVIQRPGLLRESGRFLPELILAFADVIKEGSNGRIGVFTDPAKIVVIRNTRHRMDTREKAGAWSSLEIIITCRNPSSSSVCRRGNLAENPEAHHPDGPLVFQLTDPQRSLARFKSVQFFS